MGGTNTESKVYWKAVAPLFISRNQFGIDHSKFKKAISSIEDFENLFVWLCDHRSKDGTINWGNKYNRWPCAADAQAWLEAWAGHQYDGVHALLLKLIDEACEKKNKDSVYPYYVKLLPEHLIWKRNYEAQQADRCVLVFRLFIEECYNNGNRKTLLALIDSKDFRASPSDPWPMDAKLRHLKKPDRSFMAVDTPADKKGEDCFEDDEDIGHDEDGKDDYDDALVLALALKSIPPHQLTNYRAWLQAFGIAIIST